MRRPIQSAETLDKAFYNDEEIYKNSIDAIFCSSWLFLYDEQRLLRQSANVYPIRLLEKCVDEPLILVIDDDKIKCMTNVCTHRAFQLVHHRTKVKQIVCEYHGRRFDLNGQMQHMPMFEETEDFPRACDHLHQLPLQKWKRFLFTSIASKVDFTKTASYLDQRLYHMDMSSWRHATEFGKVYNIKSNWALYVDNYLEGFHIPFVHEGLSSIIDFGQYTTMCEDQIVLQIGYGKAGDPVLELPTGHPDEGKHVTAYYYWIYPNFMLNIYNWGVQTNVVKPMGHKYCKVEFEYYIADQELWERFGKDELAEKTEREDEYVVEAVQKGLASRFYKNGRYSPKMENGVYHFHSMIKEAMGLQ